MGVGTYWQDGVSFLGYLAERNKTAHTFLLCSRGLIVDAPKLSINMANKKLNAAKKAKKDEFYTQLSDIERELQHYRQHFRGKTVLCNCDDPYESNFFKYFALNFNSLGLRKLICTCYNGSPVQGNELQLRLKGFDIEPKRQAYKVEITEVSDFNSDGAVDLSDVRYLLQNDRNVLTYLKTGDFRSRECIELLEQADIVVTNPPFSLFREYIAQLVGYGKKFIVIGHQNAITYKEIFPLIRQNMIWLGYGFKGMAAHFYSPYEDIATASDHRKNMIRVSGVTWYTNIETSKRQEEIDLVCRYNPEDYPKYEDIDAIDVSESLAIPYDYANMMGVPITFLYHFNPAQFELIGCCEPCLSLSTLRKMPNFKEYKSRQKMYNGILCQKKYHRLIIRNKHPKNQ